MSESKEGNSTSHSTQTGYIVEVRDNLPDIKPIIVDGIKLIGKDWVKLRPEWLEGIPPHFNYNPEDSTHTDYRRNGLLPYASAMALGWCFLSYCRLRQVEFRVVAVELVQDITTARKTEGESIKLKNYGQEL